MPRIDAPTVAEHHVMRRDAIIAAARDLLGTAGASAVTPAAVAGRSGLARTSVYQYFPCLLYTSPSPRDGLLSRMPSSA